MLPMSGFFAEIMSGWDYWVILVINIFFYNPRKNAAFLWLGVAITFQFSYSNEIKAVILQFMTLRERERDTLFLVHLRTNNIATKIWAPSQAWPWCLMNLRITTLSGAIWTEKRALINVYVCKISCFEFRFVFFLCPNITENMGTCN